MGALGTAHYERGLAYFEVELSGHMVPQFSPVVSHIFYSAKLSVSYPLLLRLRSKSWNS